MRSPARSSFPARSNSHPDVFLPLHLEPEVYDASHLYDMVSEKHSSKYLVLGYQLTSLTETPPKSKWVLALRDVKAIDLIDGYPGFLSPQDRETNQHIHIVYSKFLLPFHHTNAENKKVKEENNGSFFRGKEPKSLDESSLRSEEKIKHFNQLKSELFLKDNTLRKILYLIMELKVAAQKNFILERLFWKTSDLFYSVNKLHEYLPENRDNNALQNKSQRTDELVVCIEIIQTLGLMLRETETESSHLNTLAAKLYSLIAFYLFFKGTLINLLVTLISKPQIPKSCPIQLMADSLLEMSLDAEYPTFMDTTFVHSIVKQVVKGLLASFQLLSPSQTVLLYQQFYILKSRLQYSKTLAEYIRRNNREEFRYCIHMPALGKRLPLCYPITQPTAQLFHEVLKLVEQTQCVKC
ncbi:LOW QUALITY PROTEIN: uncharacterized protein C12orf56 homolog [Glossophaga mutica]